MEKMLYYDNFKELSEITSIEQLTTKSWEGRSYPEGKDINVKLKASFKIDKKVVSGYIDVDDEGDVLRIEVKGGIIKYPFLVLDYMSTNPEIVNYGRIMYKINEDFTRMEGKVVGYSGERDFFVIANSELVCSD